MLRRKAAALGLTARVHAADMRDFTLPRRYALIVIPFRAFLHNLATTDQLARCAPAASTSSPAGGWWWISSTRASPA